MRRLALVAERLAHMSGLIRERQRVTVRELADEYGVTAVTVRSDLDRLEARGEIRRVHGGAVSMAYLSHEGSFYARSAEQLDAKSKIAAAAAEMIKDGTNIIIDAGTTTLEIAKLIGDRKGLHVVTNSLPVANQLAGKPGIRLTVIGGDLSDVNLCMVGPSSVRALENIRTHQAFIGAWGIDIEAGFTCSDSSEAEVRRTAIACSREAIVVADSSKFGRVSLFSFAGLGDIAVLISDAEVDRETRETFHQAGVKALFV